MKNETNKVSGEGATLIEALRDVAGKIGVSSLDELDWSFEREHFRGGAWSVLVSAKTLDPAVLEQRRADEALVATGMDWLRELLGHFHNEDAALRTGRRGDDVVINIEGAPDARLLIGRDGRNLPAFQHLLSKVMTRAGQGDRVLLDVDGFAGDQQDGFENHVRDAIAHVLATGESVRLPEMNGYDRRQVHTLVLETAGLTSTSLGEGTMKSVEISRVEA
mgnify:CR=1 FL=1